MLKKIVITILIIACISLVGCTPVGHKHTLGQWEVGTQATCTEDGLKVRKCTDCGEIVESLKIDALGHDYGATTGTDFFKSLCRNGCGQFGLTQSNSFDDIVDYDFNLPKGTSQQEIDTLYNQIMEYLDGVELYDQNLHAYQENSVIQLDNNEFKTNFFDKFDAYDYYLKNQEYIAEFLFYKYLGFDEFELAKNRYQEVESAYNNYNSSKYKIYAKLYETKFREYFFSLANGWTQQRIDDMLGKARSYTSQEYLELENRIHEIVKEVDSYSNDKLIGEDTILNLYYEYVSIANRFAKLQKDSLGNNLYDNYLEYAYKVKRARTYTVEDAAKIRSFIKQISTKIIPYACDNDKELIKRVETNYTKEQKSIINDFYKSVFLNYDMFNDIKDFFTLVNNESTGGNINFYKYANEMFDINACKRTKDEIACTCIIKDSPYIYLGEGCCDTFTFIHEFGHYSNYYYNGDRSLEYDHYETHSQGLESLYLAYLKDHLDSDVYQYVLETKLSDDFFYMALTSCVDEFEYRVYTRDAQGNPYSASEYDDLFSEILKEYGLYGNANAKYWRLMTITSTGYYISYAMGLIPTVEIYIDAVEQGLDVATKKYLKTITFSDEEIFSNAVAFSDVLDYAGLSSPFEDAVYEKFYRFYMNDELDVFIPAA